MFDPSDGPLTVEQAKDLAHRVVARQGRDFVYAGRDVGPSACCYVSMRDAIDQLGRATALLKFGLIDEDATDEDTDAVMASVHADPRWEAGCLIGRILDEAGISIQRREDLIFDNGIKVVIEESDSDRPMDRRYFVGGSEGVLANYLHRMQDAQDNGLSWGEALDQGDRYLARVAEEEGAITPEYPSDED